MVEVPFTVSVHVPGQYIEPSSQCFAAAPLMAISPVLVAGAQIRTFEHERSPAVHQADPGQLAESPVGAFEHGAANQVRLLGESAPALGGQADTEHGVEPNWHGAAQLAPPPAAHVPDENPA